MSIDFEQVALDALTDDPLAKEWWDAATDRAKPYDPGGLLTMMAIHQAMKVAALAAARAIKKRL